MTQQIRMRSAAAFALLTALAVGFAFLGRWQLQRAEFNRGRVDAFVAAEVLEPVELPVHDPEALRFRRMRLGGRFDADRHILLDNMTHEGRAGYHVLTPFEPAAGSEAVLVNRGFVPSGGDRSRLPEVELDEAQTMISGRIDLLPRAALDLDSEPIMSGSTYLVSFPTIEQLEAVLDRDLAPFQLLLDPVGSGFVRDWAPPTGLADRNLAYAVQWFALSVAAIAAAVGFAVRSRRSRGAR